MVGGRGRGTLSGSFLTYVENRGFDRLSSTRLKINKPQLYVQTPNPPATRPMASQWGADHSRGLQEGGRA